ncbi:MAG TPA: glycosyltransferase family 4 protein [Actinomycetota bacterium]|nr:glycosyltransferase family 4 protein [Actinomycetota bacterium]
MRIVFLSQEYPSVGTSGGIGSYISIIGPALAARGHDVHVYVFADGHPSEGEDKGVHLHLRPLRPIRFLHDRKSLSITSLRIATARAASQAMADIEPPDVIESPEWMSQSLLLDGSLQNRTVVHLHTAIGLIARFSGHLGKDARLADLFETRTIRRASAVTSPSQLLLDLERKRGNIRTSTTRVIRMPIDLDRWETPAESTDEPVLLAVGRVEHRKGLDVLVRAVHALPDSLRDTKILAVGRSSGLVDGRPYREWLRSLAADKGVELECRDQIPRSELPALYRSARALVVPSRFDSFAMVALEALASGTPVICSSACGIAEMIRGSDAGSIVPPEDPEALRDALIHYLEDSGFATQAGTRGRALAEAQAAPDVIAAQREELFEQVAGTHAR